MNPNNIIVNKDQKYVLLWEKNLLRAYKKNNKRRQRKSSGRGSFDDLCERIQENKYLSRNCVSCCVAEEYLSCLIDGVKLSLSFRSACCCSRVIEHNARTALLELSLCVCLAASSPKRIYCVFSPLKSILQESHTQRMEFSIFSAYVYIKCALDSVARAIQATSQTWNKNKLILTHVTSLKKIELMLPNLFVLLPPLTPLIGTGFTLSMAGRFIAF